jgi:type IX secretion system substrate protein
MKKYFLLIGLACFLIPNHIFAQYSNASLNGPWLNLSANGFAYIIFDGNGNVTSLGAPVDSLHPTGTYSVTSSGAFTAALNLTFGLLPDTGQFLNDSTVISHNAATGPSLDIEVTNPGALEGTWSGRIYDSTTLSSRNIQFTVSSSGAITSATGITITAGNIFEAIDTFACYITTTDSDCHLDYIQMGGLYVGGNTLEGLCSLGAGYNGCSSKGNVYFTKVNTGVATISSSIDFSVYPNPFTDLVELKVVDPSDNMQVDVFDMLGRKLYIQKWGNTQNISLNLGTLSSGMYLLTLTTEGKTITTRILKN